MNLSTFRLCLLGFGLDVVVVTAFSNNVRVDPSAHKACRGMMNQSGRHRHLPTPPPTQSHRFAKSKNDDDEEIDPDDEEDWRAFRAKLVMSEDPSSSPQSSAGVENTEDTIVDDSDLDGIGSLFSDGSSSTAFTPLDPSQWAYDSGKVIEKGAVILGGVEQDFGFGLRQQYFHKAVILVLDHD
eukprot:CAMPEP_0201944604 /NCGR_PEP_ID=MMETSP0903-20130614/53442_1 /ASSEMBLY_ACC=CAM_ASM_000552 /TAXON_ID=420261 /ORGANISM="Thalassiosira antarctica, Strain CCMP982" /LENGTH=182 /DNA_ID=CAMNT_0048487645 /DNA_START=67 /DNA_END=612 /DNA_ORIENTATION=-